MPESVDGFRSVFVGTGDVRLHAEVGGRGAPLLLIHGWPQTWYTWRHMMPTLADNFHVVAMDLRGSGESEAPDTGYDTGTLAADALALMASLGHETFAVVGHDVGMGVAYALASDYPDKITHLAVAEAVLPGVFPSPPLFQPNAANERLWHFSFNRLEHLNEDLVRGREHLFFGYMFANKAATPTAVPQEAINAYIEPIAADQQYLRASFNYYRDIDKSTEQNNVRRVAKLSMPVLAVGGGLSVGSGVEATMQEVADDVRGSVLEGVGHYLPDEEPIKFASLLTSFLNS